jgi:hypothetical protein
MNAIRSSEIRTYHDIQAQADLERMLKARHERMEARAATARANATMERIRENDASGCAECDDVPDQREPFGWIDSAVFLAPMAIVTVLILIARWSGWLS